MKRRLSHSICIRLLSPIAMLIVLLPKLCAEPPLTRDVISQNVTRVVERIRDLKPAEPTNDNQMDIYLFDIETGKIEIAFDDPTLELGTPFWSHDGLRILYDATPGRKWNRTQFLMLDAEDEDAEVTMHGFGNCPTISSDGKRMSFMLNRGTLPDTEKGVWVMDLEGSDMRPLGLYGHPRWAPHGNNILIARFGRITVVDATSGEQQSVELAQHTFQSKPYWAGDASTIVAGIDGVDGYSIALLDISTPGESHITRILWKQGNGLGVEILSPVYSPITQKCVFSEKKEDGCRLYVLSTEEEAIPQLVESSGPVPELAELAISPDGRYVLFCSDRALRPLLKTGSE